MRSRSPHAPAGPPHKRDIDPSRPDPGEMEVRMVKGSRRDEPNRLWGMLSREERVDKSRRALTFAVTMF